ncbi:hypothetical protein ACA910_014468 [Epithemia clementina (nom. ined.)]
MQCQRRELKYYPAVFFGLFSVGAEILSQAQLGVFCSQSSQGQFQYYDLLFECGDNLDFTVESYPNIGSNRYTCRFAESVSVPNQLLTLKALTEFTNLQSFGDLICNRLDATLLILIPQVHPHVTSSPHSVPSETNLPTMTTIAP